MKRAETLTDRCVFMTSPMRVGSTLVSRIVSAHPLVEIGYDSVNFFRFCYHRYDPIADVANARRLFADVAYRIYHRFEMRLDPEACLEQMGTDNPTYGQAYVSLFRSLFAKTGKPIVGDKEPLAWRSIPDFLRMCPNGKAVVILRDPRDVVASFQHETIAPGNDYLIALFNVIDAVNHVFRYRAQWPDRVAIVQFEHLLTNMRQEVQRLCEFLELEFAPEMLDVRCYTDRVGSRWDPTSALTFKTETDPMAPLGRWKRILEPEDLWLCEWIGARQIGQLGFGLSGQRHPQAVFDRAVEKLMSSPLLREAFKHWCDVGEGVQRFPLDPLQPALWCPNHVKHPEAFSGQAEPSPLRAA